MLNIMLTWKSGLVFQWFSLVKRWKGNDPSLWSRMLNMEGWIGQMMEWKQSIVVVWCAEYMVLT